MANNYVELNENQLNAIIGGAPTSSIFDPEAWWKYMLAHPSHTELPRCEYYPPAYPGKIVPQC